MKLLTRKPKPRFKLDVTRAQLLALAEGWQRKTRPFRLTVTKRELLHLQDAVDDAVGEFDAGRAPAAKVALSRRLHALTGEPLPPSTTKHAPKTGGAA